MFQVNSTDNMIQNMLDAGCSEKEVFCFCECRQKQSRKEELDILENHRKDLLKEIHQIRHNIEILDKLIRILRGGSI